MAWHVDTTIQPDHTVHVWPGIEHDLTRPCVCQPSLEEQPSGRVLVSHHSLDGRELTEPA